MTGGSVGSPAARAGGVVSRLGEGGLGYISPPIFFVVEEHPSSPIDRAARRWEGGRAPAMLAVLRVSRRSCRSNPANRSKRGRIQIMTAHSLVVGNDMHPEYASVHCGYVHRLRFFFIDSVYALATMGRTLSFAHWPTVAGGRHE
jgi:hypothetical protein